MKQNIIFALLIIVSIVNATTASSKSSKPKDTHHKSYMNLTLISHNITALETSSERELAKTKLYC